MKNLIKSVFTATMYIIAVLFLGMLVSFIISSIVYWVNPVYITFRECIANAGFVVFSVMGVVASCIYLGQQYDANK